MIEHKMSDTQKQIPASTCQQQDPRAGSQSWIPELDPRAGSQSWIPLWRIPEEDPMRWIPQKRILEQ